MNKKKLIILACIVAILGLSLMAGCRSKQRMGMVRDEQTGLLYGSMTSGSFVIDPSQFDSPTLKVTIRNTSGDPAVNLKALRSTLEASYRDRGYKIVRNGKYSVHLDINLRYSGQISKDVADEVGLIGLGGGAYAGARIGKSADAVVAGGASGAAIGTIMGQYMTQDTYILLADTVLALVDKNAKKRTMIIEFGDTQIEREGEDTGFTSYRVREKTQVAVYAGGDNTPQSEIVRGVTLRFKRILRDII